MLQVLKLFLASRNASIKEVHFPAELGPSYVYASPEAIHEAVEQFLGIEASGGPRGTLEGDEESKKKQRARRSARARSKKPKKKKPLAKPKPPGSDGLVPAREAGEAGGARSPPAGSTAASRSSTRPGFPPAPTTPKATATNTSRTRASTTSRTRTTSATRPTAWSRSCDCPTAPTTSACRDPAAGPTRRSSTTRAETKTINGREYEFFADGGRIKLIAWHRGDNTYWVSNDLLQSLTNDQMVGMARSADVIVPRESRRQGKEEDERAARAGRGDRGRLGGPGHRGLLRRAGPPGDRPRHPPGEGRVALPRRGDDPRARAGRAAAPQRRADHLHHRHAELLERRAPALRLRRHAADLLRRRRPLAGPLGGRGAARPTATTC